MSLSGIIGTNMTSWILDGKIKKSLFIFLEDTIICQVINREKNKKLLETLPHDKILDLAVTYHCLIQEGEDGIGTVRISKEHLAIIIVYLFGKIIKKLRI